MVGNFVDRLGVVVVLLINALCFGVACFYIYYADNVEKIFQSAADIGHIRNVLGDDIHCALERVLGGVDLFLLVYVVLGKLNSRRAVCCLKIDSLSERFKSLFSCNGGSRLSLGLERTVNVLQFRKSCRLIECGGDFIGQLFLTLDR